MLAIGRDPLPTAVRRVRVGVFPPTISAAPETARQAEAEVRQPGAAGSSWAMTCSFGS